ncbi:hypothetical protein GCM10009865_47580 [Aeromicrobium ponti]|uniref:Uncharacterized protein n=1 Tax=Cytobacillus oceanisediminis TaxID=665099 RepID=A0A562JCX5_9BACI|nr:hypothetical protein [Cytobacillus oceanisediminis]TWH80999.1 hypothetical protein IQ19_04416 [Cytobacillus oceanisediminis]
MDVLQLVKSRLGISSTVRDAYLLAIIDGVMLELSDEKGLVLDANNSYHQLFISDYVTWRYQNRDSEGSMPRHLQFRLHNLIIHVGAGNLRVDTVANVDVLPLNPNQYTVYILSTDGSYQMYINSQWTVVEMVSGVWRVVTL